MPEIELRSPADKACTHTFELSVWSQDTVFYGINKLLRRLEDSIILNDLTPLFMSCL